MLERDWTGFGHTQLRWRQATRCASATCVQVVGDHANVYVRDSKNVYGAILTFSKAEWASFLDGAKAGEFDDV